jgi:hypothetical protein
MLDVPVSFYVPTVRIDTLRTVLQWVLSDPSAAMFAVFVATQFRVCGLEVNGYMIIAVGAKSLERINQALSSRLP